MGLGQGHKYLPVCEEDIQWDVGFIDGRKGDRLASSPKPSAFR